MAAKAHDEDLIVRPLPFIEVLSFSPPLCITKSDCDQAVDRFAKGLAAATPQLEALAADAT